MKLTIEIEVPDDIDPCAHGCETGCPFGSFDEDGDYCWDKKRTEDGFTCIVKEAMEKGSKDE